MMNLKIEKKNRYTPKKSTLWSKSAILVVGGGGKSRERIQKKNSPLPYETTHLTPTRKKIHPRVKNCVESEYDIRIWFQYDFWGFISKKLFFSLFWRILLYFALYPEMTRVEVGSQKKYFLVDFDPNHHQTQKKLVGTTHNTKKTTICRSGPISQKSPK